MKIEMDELQIGFPNKENPLIFVVSRNTKDWKEIGTISEDEKKLAVLQYQFEDRDYPMFGIDDEDPLISNNLPKTAEAINLIFSIIGNRNLKEFKKIILVIHDKELFGNKGGEYPTGNNKQKLEKKGSATLYNCSSLDPNGDMDAQIKYLICNAFKDRKIDSNCEYELWSFQHESSGIYDKALKSEENVYDEMITALTPNYKKKLVDIKFRTLELLLPFHIDFIGLSACDETKRTEYWNKIKKNGFNQYIKTLNRVCSLIDGNGNDNVESISSFASDAGFDDDMNWIELNILIGKDSKANGFFELVSKNNMSDIINSIEHFKFSSDENGHMREITGWVDWYSSIIEHFDALIAAV